VNVLAVFVQPVVLTFVVGMAGFRQKILSFGPYNVGAFKEFVFTSIMNLTE